jgi:hypothetical protein
MNDGCAVCKEHNDEFPFAVVHKLSLAFMI